MMIYDYEARGAEVVLSSTNRLMLAILEEALDSFQKGLTSSDPQQRRRSLEADRWIGSEDEDFVFSFENICRCLTIDPTYVRKGLHCIRVVANQGRIVRHPYALQPEPMTISHSARRGRIGLPQQSLAR